MGEINLEEIIFSDRIKKEWSDNTLWDKILNNQKLNVPNEC